MITIRARTVGVTDIGRVGENEHRAIYFPESADVFAMYPNAVVTVLHQRPGDPDSYPVSNEFIYIEDGIVYWKVQSSDLAKEGDSRCELVFVDGGTIAKTIIYNTRILEALDGSSTPPDPWVSWQTNVTDLANQAKAAAELLENPGVTAETLAPGSEATASYDGGTFHFGIPEGPQGIQGIPGSEYTVLIQREQPGEETNKIWILPGGDTTFEVPTLTEFQALEARVAELEDRLKGG